MTAELEYHDKFRFIPINGNIEVGLSVTVREKMLKLFSEDPRRDVELIFTTEGGRVDEGLAIIDFIQSLTQDPHPMGFKGKIVGTVSGSCESIGVVMLQACSTRQMFKSALLMVHGSYLTVNETDHMEAEAHVKQLSLIRHTLSNWLASRSTKPIDYWMELMRQHHRINLSSAEALEWGLIDEVI